MWIFLFLSAFLLACNFCQRQPGCRVFHSFFGGGGARRRVETDGGWKGAWIRFSGCFVFFSHRIKQLFFPNFLTTNERAVDAVVYPRPCTKAARNLRVAHLPRFSPPLRTTLLDGNPRYLGKLQLCISFHGQANFTILFRARSTNREGLRQSRNPWTLEKLEDEVFS